MLNGLGHRIRAPPSRGRFLRALQQVLDLGNSARGLLIQQRQVNLLVRQPARPAFHPTGALRVVVDAVVVGVVRDLEGPRTLDGLAVRREEGHIAARAHIVFHGQQEQRRGVGRGVHIRKALPVDVRGRLRILVHDLAVGALTADEELELGLREREVAVAVHGVERIEGVAAEEPAEAGPRRVAGSVIAGHQRGFTDGQAGVPGNRRFPVGRRQHLGPQLLNRNHRPLKGLVERLVGSLDRRRVGQQLPVALGVRLVAGRNAAVELRQSCAQGGVGRRLRSGPHGHQQRKQPPMVAHRVNVQLQLDRVDLGPLLIRRQDAGPRAGHGHRAGQLGIVGVQHVISAHRPIYPLGAGRALAALRPHPAHLGRKAQGEVGGPHAVELEQHHRPGPGRALRGRKHDLAHGKADVRVGDDGAVGAHLHFRCLPVHVDRHRVALDLGLDAEVREQLDGQDPRLEAAVLLAHHHAAFAGHGEGLFRLRMGLNHGTGSEERNGGNGVEGAHLSATREHSKGDDHGGETAEQTVHWQLRDRCHFRVPGLGSTGCSR